VVFASDTSSSLHVNGQSNIDITSDFVVVGKFLLQIGCGELVELPSSCCNGVDTRYGGESSLRHNITTGDS
jgi:hypothetical protein